MTAASAFDLPVDQLVELLETGDIEIEGRMPRSSNATFLVTVTADGDGDGAGAATVGHEAIYKPGRGERPLWDFPPDLYKREVAAYRLADQLGWAVVPPTVIATGPYGEGSLQAFVHADFAHHYFSLLDEGIGTDDLHRLCVLDLLANNTDRKSGHCLLGRDGRVYGIDHGLAFHAQFKLRTVMWDFAGDPIPDELLAPVARLVADGPTVELAALLDRFEIDALVARAAAVVDRGRFPDDDTDGHRYPWPLI
ncbi:MAG: SCO1664 family protein [Acidimicrobiales bacterium]